MRGGLLGVGFMGRDDEEGCWRRIMERMDVYCIITCKYSLPQFRLKRKRN